MSAREARRQINRFIREAIMSNQNSVYKLYDEPAAGNEGRKDFDDPLLP
jgi:hypothetical protein